MMACDGTFPLVTLFNSRWCITLYHISRSDWLHSPNQAPALGTKCRKLKILHEYSNSHSQPSKDQQIKPSQYRSTIFPSHYHPMLILITRIHEEQLRRISLLNLLLSEPSLIFHMLLREARFHQRCCQAI